jgi:hypothetical protein
MQQASYVLAARLPEIHGRNRRILCTSTESDTHRFHRQRHRKESCGDHQSRHLVAGDEDVLEERFRNVGVAFRWHRSVAFGKLADFAGALKKGAHVAIEGELRSHEYEREVAVGAEKKTVTQRVWEICVDTILKLDRAPGVKESAGTAASKSQ